MAGGSAGKAGLAAAEGEEGETGETGCGGILKGFVPAGPPARPDGVIDFFAVSAAGLICFFPAPPLVSSFLGLDCFVGATVFGGSTLIREGFR